MTSNAFRYPYNLSDPIGSTHYDSTFNEKRPIDRAEPIRSGTSSGNRANNPHPTNEFMVFRFRPLKLTANPNSDWSQPIGDKLLSQCIKSQMKSVYSSDYVNNVEEKAKFEEQAKNTLRLSSVARKAEWAKQKELEQKSGVQPFQYNHPFSYESLHISPTRFGSSRRYVQPAQGILPNVSRYCYPN